MANKGGKYAAFKKLYPKVPIEATTFDKINAVLDEVTDAGSMRVRDLTNFDVKGLYVEARKKKAQLESELSVWSTRVAALTYLFNERMEEEDVTSLSFTDGVALGASVEPYANVKDRTALISWIKETGQEDLLTLNYQTLNTIVKERLVEGKPVPPGVDVFMKDKLTARGLNIKGE